MIIPAILESDFEEVKRKLTTIENVANLIHIDVEDGKLVEHTTFSNLSELDEIETSCAFELHLMVEDPEDYLDMRIKKAIKICSQVEISKTKIETFLKKSKELGYKVGLSLKTETELNELDSYIEDLDFVQLMSVEIGVQGQKFNEDILKKIKDLRKKHPHLSIQIDGGIDQTHLAKILDAGANSAVIGAHIVEAKNPEEAVVEFKEIAEKHAN